MRVLTNVDPAGLKSTPAHLSVESKIAEAGMFGESAIFIHHEVLEVVANSDCVLSWSYKVSGTGWE